MCSIGLVMTNAQGVARFTTLKLGSVIARAFKVGDIFVDVTQATAVVPGDGQTGFAVMKFAGVGSVTGIVLLPDGTPAMGADVSLHSNFYSAEMCTCPGDSHRVTTDRPVNSISSASTSARSASR
jgi:hypothetical protein